MSRCVKVACQAGQGGGLISGKGYKRAEFQGGTWVAMVLGRWRMVRYREDSRMHYVNVYLEDQAYGGPEEGGWYYSLGSPDASLTGYESQRATPKRIERARRLAARENANRPSQYHSNSEGEFVVRVERHRPRAYPEYHPHYE